MKVRKDSVVENQPITDTSASTYNRFSAEGETTGVRINTLGNNTVLTPASGKRLKIKWVGLSTPAANSAEVLAQVKLGNSVKYRWNLDNPGAFSHWQVLTGGVDESLIINLSAAQNVDVNYTWVEID